MNCARSAPVLLPAAKRVLSENPRPDLMGCALCRRPLTIARCSEIVDFGHFWRCILLVLVPKPIVWQACGLHFGILGGCGTIQEHLGAQERIPWGPGLDFYRFWVDFGSAFRVPWTKIGVFFHACFQVTFLKDFGL